MRHLAAGLSIMASCTCLADEHSNSPSYQNRMHNIHGQYAFTGNLSVAEGCELAAARVRQHAVATQCGTRMDAGVLRTRSETMDDLARFHLETLGGKVVHWKTLRLDIERIAQPDLLFSCNIEAEISVHCEQGMRDPAFMAITAQLDKSTYREGEAMHIQIDAVPHARYLTAIQLLPYLDEPQQIWMLSTERSAHFRSIPANTAAHIPDSHLVLEPRLPDGRKQADEMLMLIATRQAPPAFPPKMSIASFHRWLTDIPLPDRREIVLPYRVIR